MAVLASSDAMQRCRDPLSFSRDDSICGFATSSGKAEAKDSAVPAHAAAPLRHKVITIHSSLKSRSSHTQAIISPPNSYTQSTSLPHPNSYAQSTSLPHPKSYTINPPPPVHAMPTSNLPSTCRSTGSPCLSKYGMKVVALDCEMVGCLEIHLSHTMRRKSTSIGGVASTISMKPQKWKKRKPLFHEVSVAGKCSIVDYNGAVLFDEFINPEIQVHDPRTRYSGIRCQDLNNAMPLSVAQARIVELLHQAVLVGHAIKNDLDALFLTHPQDAIRDTSGFLPLRKMAGLSEANPPSLKTLTMKLLGQVIQVRQHSSLEDAASTMQLYKLVEESWEDSLIGKVDRTIAPVPGVVV